MKAAYYIDLIERKLERLKPRMSVTMLRIEFDGCFAGNDESRWVTRLKTFSNKLDKLIDETEEAV